MTNPEIQEKVRSSLENGHSNIMMLQNISSKLKSLITVGNEHDADSICHISKSGGDISVVFIVGRSVLTGEEAYKWVLDYHNNNPAAAKRCIGQIADFAVEGLAADEECVMPFKDTKNKAWRAFRAQVDGSMQTVDEIRKKALFKLGRKSSQ